jgi:lysophospholipase L1-like esterase
MNPRLAKLSKKLALSAASLVVILGGAELACRVAGLGPSPGHFKWIADKDVLIRPMPDQDVFFSEHEPAPGHGRVPLHINHHGQRGADYPLAKPAAELRLMVLGDSLTMGKDVRDDETYPAQLEALLNARGPEGQAVRVINAGVNGWATWHYMRWAETKLARFDSDVLVLGLYLGNDMVLPSAAATTIPVPMENLLRDSALYHFVIGQYRERLWKRVEAAKRNMTLGELEAQLEVYRGVRESDLSEEDQRILWEKNSFAHLARVRDACRAADQRFVCLLIPTWGVVSGVATDTIHEFLREHLESIEVPVVTCLDELRVAGREAWLPWDTGHLSVAGNGVVAGALERGLDLGH